MSKFEYHDYYYGMSVKQIIDIKHKVDEIFNGNAEEMIEFLEDHKASIKHLKGQLAIATAKLQRIQKIVREV